MKHTHRLLIRLLVFVLLAGSVVFAQKTVHVKTYTRKDGTVVQSHNRAAPGTANRSTTSSPSRSSNTANTSIYNAPVYTAPVYAPAYPSSTSRARSVTGERDSNGRIKRSASAKHDFTLSNPCPITGRTSGPCPGYVIDHVYPLACGGADSPLNMQWQTADAAKAKDKWERKGCR